MRRSFLLLLVTALWVPTAQAADVLLSGSAAIDYRFITGPNAPSNPSPLGITGLTAELAQKAVAEVGHGVSFSVKVCAGCHGLEVDQAAAELRFKRFFNVRAGRLNVPFGEFGVRHDPTNFTTPSKPLPYAMGDMLFYGSDGFNLGIVPAPYVDNGVEVFGSLSLGTTTQLDYSAYVVKGLVGENDLDFASSRQFLDANRLPAGGARLVLTGTDWGVGSSFSAGTADARDQRWYLMGGVDVFLRLGSFTVRAEALARRTDLDPTASYRFELIDPWFLKAGWYAQVDWEVLPKLVAIFRTDGLQRLGMPLPESNLSPSAGVQRQTLAVLVRVNDHAGLKADYELWSFQGNGDERLRHVVRAGVVVGY